MPEVFANTTPLQYLHRLGQMDWLREFYGRIVVPVAVADELEAGRRLGARVPDLTAFPWIEIRRAPEPMPAFPRFIHRGEAEVLALAQAADAPQPKARAAFWEAKFSRNAERDREVTRTLRRAGWRVVRVWECALVRRREAAMARRVAQALARIGL